MNLDSQWFRTAAWACVLLLIAAAAYLVWQGRWQAFGTMLGFAAAVGLLIVLRNQMPSILEFLAGLVGLANAGGWVWNWYKEVPGYDEAVHGFTMCVIGLVVGFYIHYAREDEPRRTHPGAAFVGWIIALSLLVGLAWEGVEWAFNIIGSAWDTFFDLLMDTLGGLVAGLLAAWAIRSKPPRQLQEGRPSRTPHSAVGNR